MPEIYRAPLVLRYMDGFATKEIARLSMCPWGRSWPGCIGAASRELWTYAQETDSSSRGQSK